MFLKAIKRSFPSGKMEKENKEKLIDVIYRYSLFSHNISNFIELFYVCENSNYELVLDDFQIIFDILKLGDKYIDKKHQFYIFFNSTFKNYYFNPEKEKDKDKNENENKNKDENIDINKDENKNISLIDGKYLDQVMKLNYGVMFSAIINNIKYNFDKYLFRLIKTKFNLYLKNNIEYNRLIKKCSSYEMYKNNKNYNEILTIIVNLITKKTENNKFDIKLLENLASMLNEKTKSFKIIRSVNNSFNAEIEQIRDFENNFNINKSLIKKIISGEKNKEEIKKLKDDYKKIYDEILIFFPENIIFTNYNNELNKNPFKFINVMIKINNFLSDNKAKTFNVFPKSRKLIPKNVTFDTNSINVIFLHNKYNKNISDNIENIWKTVFNFPKSFFKMNNKLQFKGTIQTDGISLTLLYQSEENKEKKIIKQKAMLAGRLEDNKKKREIEQKIYLEYNDKLNQLQVCCDDTKVTIEKIKLELKKSISEKQKKELNDEIDDFLLKNKKRENQIIELNEKIDEKISNALTTYKKSKEINKKKKKDTEIDKKKIYVKQYIENKKEQIKKLEEENKLDEIKKIQRKYQEFFYIDDLTEPELKELENAQKMYFDLGKTRLFYALAKIKKNNIETNKFIKYTGKERGKNLKTEQHRNNTNKLMKKLGISEIHNKLASVNLKSTKKEDLENNLKFLNNENSKIYNKYLNKKFRQEKLQTYKDKQKTEKFMINKILNQLGLSKIADLKNITAIVGDWVGCNQLKNSKSTLGIGMKRMLKKYFGKMYLISEVNTSKLNHITHTEMTNHTLELTSIRKKNEKGEKLEKVETKIIYKRMHEILTFTTDKKSISNVLHRNDEKEEKREITENGKKIMIPIIRRYIQRDKNAVLNFEYLLEYYLKNKSRPKEYTIRKKINNAEK